jgi:hypothetical protein
VLGLVSNTFSLGAAASPAVMPKFVRFEDVEKLHANLNVDGFRDARPFRDARHKQRLVASHRQVRIFCRYEWKIRAGKKGRRGKRPIAPSTFK